jgi:hypothetical protein
MVLIEDNDPRFYLAPSKLPGGGTGVFAKVSLKKGDHMEIVGVMVPVKSDTDRCTAYAHDYKFASRLKDADRYVIPMGYAGLVNHAIDRVGMNMRLEYLKGVTPKNPNAGSAVLMCTRDVAEGEELLHYYGDDWNERLRKYSDEAHAWDEISASDVYGLGKLLSK